MGNQYDIEKLKKKRTPKNVKCPKCNNVGETIVKEECLWYYILTLFIPLLFVAIILYEAKKSKETGQKFMTHIVHRCRFCNHNCTKVKEYKGESQCCLII